LGLFAWHYDQLLGVPMRLQNLLESVMHTPSTTSKSFRIPDGHVLDVDAAGQAPAFVPEETYFEIRLSQLHLQYRRENWRQFIPLASLMTQFLYAGERRTVPFVVGPELLASVPQLDKRDEVEFRNIRVVGPYPYAGDDLELFAGLFRVVTGDWAGPVLSLLESVTKAFDLSKLSSFVSVTEPLVSGIEQLLGMRDVELRMAMYRQMATPSDETAQRQHGTVLQRGYYVLIGALARPLGDGEQEALRVRDGMLWRADSKGLVEFKEADFLLFQLVPLLSRPDYTTFDFHKIYWPKVVDHIWNGHPDAARQTLRLLATSLAQCQDITAPHRMRLLTAYRMKFDEELAAEQLFEEQGAGQGFEEAPRSPLSEADLRTAVETGDRGPAAAPAGNYQPETMLSELGI
jgi:hypothetical protein